MTPRYQKFNDFFKDYDLEFYNTKKKKKPKSPAVRSDIEDAKTFFLGESTR